jgi:hypothetical protein
MFKFAFTFATLALAAASAATYTVNLSSPVSASGKKLMPGQYKVDVEGDKATFKKGKEVIELPVAVEEVASKYKENQINTRDSQLLEIHVGGTKVKMTFKPETTSMPAGGGQ